MKYENICDCGVVFFFSVFKSFFHGSPISTVWRRSQRLSIFYNESDNCIYIRDVNKQIECKYWQI